MFSFLRWVDVWVPLTFRLTAMIILRNSMHIGSGLHKMTFAHPDYRDRCVKIAVGDLGLRDMSRELHYRSVRKFFGRKSSLLPEYFGSTMTSMGKGYMFEHIRDFDGARSLTLLDFLGDVKQSEKHRETPNTAIVMRDFKMRLFKERLVTMDLFPQNILFQRETMNQTRVMLVNDLGSASLIPLEYYLPLFAHLRLIRRWKRFVYHLATSYKSQCASTLANILRD